MTIGKTVLLTGANGFLGTAAASLLLKKGYNLKCAIRKSSKLNKHFECEYVYADLNDKLPDDLFNDVDIVIHAAGLTKTTDGVIIIKLIMRNKKSGFVYQLI